MRARLVKILLLISALVIVGLVSALALAQSENQTQDEDTRLLWVEFNVGGRVERIKAGDALLLHPDAPFKVEDAKSNAFWDLGLMSYRIGDRPDVDLETFHTLQKLLGNKVYDQEGLVVEVLRAGLLLGMVTVKVRLLPIDWLRQAEAAQDLNDKIRFTQKAWQASDGDKLLLKRLADLLMEAQRFQEALALIEAQDAAIGDPALLKLLVELYEKAGQTQKAAGALSQLLSEDPHNTALMAKLAGLYEKLQRWEESAALYERLLDKYKGSQRAATLRRLAALWDQAGQKQKALMALERAAKHAPLDAALWQTLAQARQDMGDQGGAARAWARAVELKPIDGGLRMKLADSLLVMGKKKEAAAELEKASKLRPQDAALLSRLAKLYQDLDDPEGQARVYARLAPLKPDDPNLHYNLAVLALEKKDYQTALKSLTLADKAKPGDREILLTKVEVLLKLKKWKQAAKLTGRLLAEDPKDLKLIKMVFPQLSTKRPKEMAAFLLLTQAALPTEASLYEMRAALALDADDTGAAKKALSQGVKALPNHAGLWYQLAQVLLARDEKKRALAALEKVLDLDPKNTEAEERFLELKFELRPAKSGPDNSPRELDPEPLPPDPKPSAGAKVKP